MPGFCRIKAKISFFPIFLLVFIPLSAAITVNDFKKPVVNYEIDSNYPVERVDDNCFKAQALSKANLNTLPSLTIEDLALIDLYQMPIYKDKQLVKFYDYTKENIICHNQVEGVYKWGFHSTNITVTDVSEGYYWQTNYNATQAAVVVNATGGFSNGNYTYYLNYSEQYRSNKLNLSYVDSGTNTSVVVRRNFMNITKLRYWWGFEEGYGSTVQAHKGTTLTAGDPADYTWNTTDYCKIGNCIQSHNNLDPQFSGSVTMTLSKGFEYCYWLRADTDFIGGDWMLYENNVVRLQQGNRDFDIYFWNATNQQRLYDTSDMPAGTYTSGWNLYCINYINSTNTVEAYYGCTKLDDFILGFTPKDLTNGVMLNNFGGNVGDYAYLDDIYFFNESLTASERQLLCDMTITNFTGPTPRNYSNPYLNYDIDYNYLKIDFKLGKQDSMLYNFTVKNETTSQGAAPPDVTAPTITLLRNTSTTNISSYVEWTCDENCNYTIRLYNDSAKTSLAFVTYNNSFALTHNPHFASLINSTTYYINLSVWDAAGNKAENNTFSFTTAKSPEPSGCTIPTEDLVISSDTILCAGTYYLNDSNKNGVLNITASGVTLDCNNANLIGNSSTNSFAIYVYNSKKNVTIKNCNIEGYKYGIWVHSTTHNTTIEYNNFSNTIHSGVFSYGNNFLRIKDNNFFNSSIYITSNNNASIIRNNITCLNSSCSQSNSAGIIMRFNKESRVEKNKVYDAQFGISLYRINEEINITQNEIYQADRGIYLHDIPHGRVYINKNKLINNSGNYDGYLLDIHIENSSNMIIDDNNFSESVDTSILLTQANNITISNNNFDMVCKTGRENYDGNAQNEPCTVIMAKELYKTWCYGCSSYTYGNIHQRSSNNITINGNNYDSTDATAYFTGQGTGNLTHDFNDFYYKRFNLGNISDDIEFYINSNITNVSSNIRGYTENTSGSNLYEGLQLGIYWFYGIKNNTMLFKNQKAYNQDLTIYNLTSPYNDIFNQTCYSEGGNFNDCTLDRDQTTYSLTIAPYNEIRVGNYSNTKPNQPTIIYPIDGTNYSNVTNINYTATDQNNDSLTYYIYVNDTINISGIAGNVTSWNVSDGYYQMKVSAYDGYDYSDNATVTFRVDTSAPIVSLISPKQNYYNDTTPITKFNCSAADVSGLSYFKLYLTDKLNVSYHLNETQSTTSAYHVFTKTLSNGNYTWGCGAIDGVGNEGNSTTNRSLTINQSVIDTTAPTVSLNYPSNGASVSGNDITFNCSATDTTNNLKSMAIYGNWSGVWILNETNSTAVGKKSETYYFNKNMPQGSFVWNCYSCDLLDNCGFGAANYTFRLYYPQTFIPTIDDYGIEWITFAWTGTASIQYSDDNLTWSEISSLDNTLNKGYQVNLQEETVYYFRSKNDTTGWHYFTQETKSTDEVDDYYLYIVIFICFISLLGLGYLSNDYIFEILAGILIILTGISIYVNSFPNLNNEYLKNVLVAIMMGIGFYYIIVPSIRKMEEWLR